MYLIDQLQHLQRSCRIVLYYSEIVGQSTLTIPELYHFQRYAELIHSLAWAVYDRK